MQTVTDMKTTATRFAQIDSRKRLAYRDIGEGEPIIFSNRFRGDLNSWDPAFIDALAEHHRVITFQYAGTGASRGAQANTYLDMAQDVIELADHLGLDKFSVGGWSLGGAVAQVVLTEYAGRVNRAVLIGCRVPGPNASPMQKAFFEHALKPVNDLTDETVLFFNPAYPASVEAAKASHTRIAARLEPASRSMSQPQWEKMIATAGFSDDTYGTLAKMGAGETPVLVIVGENDICFPAEDWFALKGSLPTVQIHLFPQSGHAPHHQYPAQAARLIAGFLAERR